VLGSNEEVPMVIVILAVLERPSYLPLATLQAPEGTARPT